MVVESLEALKSASATFRLPDSVLEQLKQDAASKQVSLNVLANQIFADYINWYSNAAKVGYMPIRKSFIKLIFDRLLTDEQIITAAKEISKEIKDINLLLKSEISLKSTIEIVEAHVKASGFHYRHAIDEGTHTFIVQHDMGRKFSLYMATLFEEEFLESGADGLQKVITDNTILFRLKI